MKVELKNENIIECANNILKSKGKKIEQSYLQEALNVLNDMLQDDAHGTIADIIIDYAFDFKDKDIKGISGIKYKDMACQDKNNSNDNLK